VPGVPSFWHKIVIAGAIVALAVAPASGACKRAKAPAAKPAAASRQVHVPRGGPAPASWFSWMASETLRP
jgi:hypothetical protein